MPRKSGGLLISGGQNRQPYQTGSDPCIGSQKNSRRGLKVGLFSLISFSCSVDSGKKLMKRLI